MCHETFFVTGFAVVYRHPPGWSLVVGPGDGAQRVIAHPDFLSRCIPIQESLDVTPPTNPDPSPSQTAKFAGLQLAASSPPLVLPDAGDRGPERPSHQE